MAWPHLSRKARTKKTFDLQRVFENQGPVLELVSRCREITQPPTNDHTRTRLGHLQCSIQDLSTNVVPVNIHVRICLFSHRSYQVTLSAVIQWFNTYASQIFTFLIFAGHSDHMESLCLSQLTYSMACSSSCCRHQNSFPFFCICDAVQTNPCRK